MRYPFFIFLFIFTWGLSSCEEVLDTDELPFEEHLVISGTLRTDQQGGYFQITKTLPLNVPFDTGAAFLEDAYGSVSSNGVEYPLEYDGMRGYYSVKGFTPEVGKDYHLDVHWKHLHAFANTRIPLPSQLDSVRFEEESIDHSDFINQYAKIWLRVPKGLSAEVGLIGIQVDSVKQDTGYYGSSFTLWRGSNEQVMVRPRFTIARGSRVVAVKVVVNTFASGYYELENAKYPDPDDPFSNVGPTIPWNVEGDGIGGFFGCSSDLYRYDF